MHIQLETGARQPDPRLCAGLITFNQTAMRAACRASGAIIADWPPQAFEELVLAHLAPSVPLRPETVILGTGRDSVFPASSCWRRCGSRDRLGSHGHWRRLRPTTSS